MSRKTDLSQNSDSQETSDNRVIDLSQIREKKLIQKRRQTERIFFQNFVSVYSVKNAKEILPIEMIDVSEEGCSFQIPYHPDQKWPQQSSNITLRFYFNSESYIEILANIQYSKPSIIQSKRYIRFGCSIDQTTQSYPTYEHFIKFLKLYAETSRPESGQTIIQHF